MAPSLTLNRRSAVWATLLFLVFAYEATRAAAAVTGHFAWIPHVRVAPSWARVGFHAGLGAPAAAFCAVWAYRTIASMRLHITPRLTVASARETVAGSWFARRLPSAPNRSYRVQLNSLDDWRWWGTGAALFLVTALPYWLLLILVGHIVAFGPGYLALQAGRQLPWWLDTAVGAVGLTVLVIRRRRNRRHRPPAADRPPLTIIAFIAGSEQWTAWERWRACLLYSLWLQRKGVFPLLTLATAIPSQRLVMELYRHQLAAGQTQDAALSHTLTLRTARIITGLCFYAVIAVIKVWPLMW